mgnify:CR=1 FL=1
MARIAGIDLPREKRVEIGLTYIYGIGRPMANTILKATGIDPDIRVKDLTEQQVNDLRAYVEKNVRVEGDLHREVALNIKRLMEIGCYRGVRHRRDCPFADRARSRTPAREKVRSVPSVARRRSKESER